MSFWMLIGLSVTEIFLLFLLVVFFFRLKRSESLLQLMQDKQEDLLARLHFNAELEQEVVTSFETRQNQLQNLDDALARRVEELKALLAEAENVAGKVDLKPQNPRQKIINGYKKGLSIQALSRSTGMTTDEVELIIMDARRR